MGKKQASTARPAAGRPTSRLERIRIEDIPEKLRKDIPKKTAHTPGNVIFESPIEKTEPYGRHR